MKKRVVGNPGDVVVIEIDRGIFSNPSDGDVECIGRTKPPGQGLVIARETKTKHGFTYILFPVLPYLGWVVGDAVIEVISLGHAIPCP